MAQAELRSGIKLSQSIKQGGKTGKHEQQEPWHGKDGTAAGSGDGASSRGQEARGPQEVAHEPATQLQNRLALEEVALSSESLKNQRS